jgi:hypothetical protein
VDLADNYATNCVNADTTRKASLVTYLANQNLCSLLPTCAPTKSAAKTLTRCLQASPPCGIRPVF